MAADLWNFGIETYVSPFMMKLFFMVTGMAIGGLFILPILLRNARFSDAFIANRTGGAWLGCELSKALGTGFFVAAVIGSKNEAGPIDPLANFSFAGMCLVWAVTFYGWLKAIEREKPPEPSTVQNLPLPFVYTSPYDDTH